MIEPHAGGFHLHGQFDGPADAWNRRDFVDHVFVKKIVRI